MRDPCVGNPDLSSHEHPRAVLDVIHSSFKFQTVGDPLKGRAPPAVVQSQVYRGKNQVPQTQTGPSTPSGEFFSNFDRPKSISFKTLSDVDPEILQYALQFSIEARMAPMWNRVRLRNQCSSGSLLRLLLNIGVGGALLITGPPLHPPLDIVRPPASTPADGLGFYGGLSGSRWTTKVNNTLSSLPTPLQSVAYFN